MPFDRPGDRPSPPARAAIDRPTVSFELFPPRTPKSFDALTVTIQALAAVRPDFISVTYGASGSTRQTTRELVRHLLAHTPVLPIAHLTCVGVSREDVVAVIEEFLDEGVRNFLALRGDPPKDQPNWRPRTGELVQASELVELLREVEAARCVTSASQALRGAARKLSVAVAAFPAGNPSAGSTREQDLRALLAKQEAGADFAITQVFFEAKSYLGLVRDARDLGITIPIVAGVIPTTDPARLVRLEELTGVQVPTDLLARLAAADDPAERHRVGIRASVDLADEVLDGGAPGLHIYTFNQHEAALDLLEGVHLGGGAPMAPEPASEPRVTASHPNYLTI
ncbi:methylenetetrahydrofolate reductase [Pengzhenrongella frigida]|uniref:Methylenetetrahydrofolate reductase n=1 Tax=Pengzhenrongella frigida TaxID=1259133 RepID=A0A4Q5N1D2_9MICO|nr:methylenetetrahydrofolate reductase [Cellulomonas sp. HLT2-17]RYV51865.1 methylenetetrahydrofolate reductase [Cellulomonas sp. HLT2-17]